MGPAVSDAAPAAPQPWHAVVGKRLAWAPSAPAIFTSMDIAAVRLQALREDIVIPPSPDKTPGGTKRWRGLEGAEAE